MSSSQSKMLQTQKNKNQSRKRCRATTSTQPESRYLTRSIASENSPDNFESEMDPDFDEDFEDNGLDETEGLEQEQPRKRSREEVIEDREVTKFDLAGFLKGKRSIVWKHFTPYVDPKDSEKIRARCNYCKNDFAATTTGNGTSALRRHLEKCKELPQNKGEGTQAKIVFEKVAETDLAKIKNWVLDLDVVRKNLTKLIVGEELPFMFVEKPFFRDLLLSMCPTFKIPSRYTVARDCYKLFLEEQVKMKDYLKKHCQRVCLTTDTWTSIQRVNYMSLTIHFIDKEWTLQRRILNFCPISGHKGDDIARDVEDCLRPWGLCDKIFTVTVDNASANDSACRELKRMVVANGSSIYRGKYLHMRCVAHIANRIVQAGLKLHNKCIDKVRNVVMFIRNSPARLHIFREEALRIGVDCHLVLQYDCPTRWNSCYTMLEVALKYRDVFPRLETPRDVDGVLLGHITTEEWNKIQVIVDFLKQFYNFTMKVSGSSYVTVCNVFYYIAQLLRLLDKWVSSEDEVYASMAKPMKEKCDKYWGSMDKMNMFIFVAIILDPKYKFEGLELAFHNLYGKEEGDALAKTVKDVTKELFEEYRRKYAPLYVGEQSSVNSSRFQTPSCDSFGDEPDFLLECNSQLQKRSASVGSSFTNEFDKYFHEMRDCEWNKGSLMWWKCNGHRFPILAHLARDILAIPITTVPSESAFSTGGCTIDKFRSSLSSKTVQALICTQDWLRADGRKHVVYDEVLELLQESEKVEEEVEKEMEMEMA